MVSFVVVVVVVVLVVVVVVSTQADSVVLHTNIWSTQSSSTKHSTPGPAINFCLIRAATSISNSFVIFLVSVPSSSKLAATRVPSIVTVKLFDCGPW